MRNQVNFDPSQGEGTIVASGAGYSNDIFGLTKLRIGPFLTLRAYLLFLSISIYSFTIAQSQNTVIYDAKDWGLEIVASGTSLGAGDLATVSVVFTEEVLNAVEFDLELTISNLAVFPSVNSFDFSNSWFEGSPSVTLSQDEGTVRVNGIRSAEVSGTGTLFEVYLAVAADSVMSDQLITDGGGVLIMIEDIGFKREEQMIDVPRIGRTPRLYPNPCQGRLYFDGEGTPDRLRIYNGNGEMVAEIKGEELVGGSWDTDHLPRGTYFISMERGGERFQVQRLILN